MKCKEKPESRPLWSCGFGQLSWWSLGVCNRWNRWSENQSINRYQSMKLDNWSRLVSVNRWSTNNHTKIVHRLLLTGTATLNGRHSCYLWSAPDATWSPEHEIGKTIPTQSSQRKGYTPLHMYSNNLLAHHCLSVSSGVFNWWKSMIRKPINQSIVVIDY